MSRSDVFVARLAGRAVVSTLAARLVPRHHTEGATTQVVATEAAVTKRAAAPEEGTHEATNKAIVFTVTPAPAEWDKHLEREFRQLALQEAGRALTEPESARLEQLNQWRDRLRCPLSAAEIHGQLKRDRLLVRMEELLKDYIEFEKASSKARAAA